MSVVQIIPFVTTQNKSIECNFPNKPSKSHWFLSPISSPVFSPRQLRNPLAVLGDSREEENMLVVALLDGLCAMHLLAGIGIVSQIVHGRGKGHRRGREVLHLVRDQTMLLRELAQPRHLLDGATWMRGDEVGDELLVLATLLVLTVELLQEDEELVEARLAHQP